MRLCEWKQRIILAVYFLTFWTSWLGHSFPNPLRVIHMTRTVTLRRFYRECRESLSQICFNRPPMDLDHSRFRTKTWDPKLTRCRRCDRKNLISYTTAVSCPHFNSIVYHRKNSIVLFHNRSPLNWFPRLEWPLVWKEGTAVDAWQ